MPTNIDLRKVTLFSQLSEPALAYLHAALVKRQYNPEEVIFNQGDPGNELFIIESGRIAIYTPQDGDPKKGQPIRIFQPGELLGEMAIIDRKPRSASARAAEITTVLVLSGEAFHRSIRENPDMAIAVMAGLSDRIRYTTDFLSEVRQWVGKMAEGNYQVSAPGAGPGGYKDPTIASLAAEFAQMAARVQQREETLRQEVAQLRIEIDEAKRKREVSQIMDSDYYKSLKDKVKNLRQRQE